MCATNGRLSLTCGSLVSSVDNNPSRIRASLSNSGIPIKVI